MPQIFPIITVHAWIRIGIRIPNTDPDPQSSWIRIQYGSGFTTMDPKHCSSLTSTVPPLWNFTLIHSFKKILIHPNELICLARFLKFQRLNTQAAKAYPRKPKPGVRATPFYTRLSAIEQAARKVRTEEPSASGAQPNLLPDASKNKRNVKYCV